MAEAIDKRIQRSKAAVLASTYALLSEGGIGGVSMDEVSRRSGVSKTTIYRHWPSRSALLLTACATIGSPSEVPDTGSLKGDLDALVTDLAEQLRSAKWPAILPSIMDAAERDAEVATLHATLHAALMTPFLTVAERAQARGDFPAGVTPAEMTALVVGPLFYQRWFSKEPICSDFATSAVVRALAMAVRHSIVPD
ncbi:TetR/AcrR family transcriptional regulator [Sphingomonas sp. PAMC 26621]|uniref:TetR/AcrR family transcriptional regulator n=1 Tax=Sphingomonas sp. PAMC 26621 TaxID=1112213 RepID=UPI000287F60E|nr:TetR/AcrR family transcriptional regulator [Sphingomonas sp. PAMC 26621]